MCCCCLHCLCASGTLVVLLLSRGTFWANIYNKWGGWTSSPGEPAGTMVRSRDLLRWYGQERITAHFVFSVIRSPPLCAPWINFSTPKPPFIDFSPFCHAWVGHLSYVLSTHLLPYFTFNQGLLYPARLRNIPPFAPDPIKSSRASYSIWG